MQNVIDEIQLFRRHSLSDDAGGSFKILKIYS